MKCETCDYPASWFSDLLDLGSRHFVRPNGVGGYFWWHDCPVTRAWHWFGKGESEASGHVVVVDDPLTVQGSLVCVECGDHGFIEEGRWRAA